MKRNAMKTIELLHPSSLCKNTLKLALVLSMALTLVACGSNKSKPMNVEGAIAATTVLNPTIKGEYRPVNIKVYYLVSDKQFSQASFKDLFQSPDKALGEDILHISSHQILPGQSIELAEEVPLGMKYIGAVAAYRNLQGAKWRDIKAVPDKCFFCFGNGLWDPILISAERLSIEIDVGDD